MAFPIQRTDRLSLGLISPQHYKRINHVTLPLVDRLELDGVLRGHQGCVNCLEWNERGTVLASGSDDCHLILWDPFTKKLLLKLNSTHDANIFSVKFLSNVTEDLVVTGAADTRICLHDINRMECLRTFNCHAGRVKRITNTVSEPFLFWSAAEDGTVRQFDIRESAQAVNSRNVLVNLAHHIGPEAEAKGLALNPLRPEMLAVGGNDPFVRIYDRRQLKLHAVDQLITRSRVTRTITLLPSRESSRNNAVDGVPFAVGAVRYLVPGHSVSSESSHHLSPRRQTIVTSVAFSPDGTHLLSNMGGDHIYLYPLNRSMELLGLTPPTSSQRANSPLMVLSPDDEGAVRPSASIPSCHRYPRYREMAVACDDAPQQQQHRRRWGGGQASEAMRDSAARLVVARAYAAAVRRYNELICCHPDDAQLYTGRATALVKRNWNGDCYGAFLDCQTTIRLTGKQLPQTGDHWAINPYDGLYHVKVTQATAILLAARCLMNLRWLEEARSCLDSVCRLHPQLVRSPCPPGEPDEEEAADSVSCSSGSRSEAGETSNDPVLHLCSLQGCFDLLNDELRAREAKCRAARHGKRNRERNGSKRRKRPPQGQRSNHVLRVIREPSTGEPSRRTEGNENQEAAGSGSGEGRMRGSRLFCGCLGCLAAEERTDPNERCWFSQATDYTKRYVGHCNIITDIKEANFFGSDGQFIVGGSDCGSLFIWDRSTTNTVRILAADSSTVNCVQPHPSVCLLASSGIDSHVSIWTPQNEYDENDSRVVKDHVGTAERNQRRSTADPLEIMLSNLGYRFPGLWSSSSSPSDHNRTNTEDGNDAASTGGGGDGAPEDSSTPVGSSDPTRDEAVSGSHTQPLRRSRRIAAATAAAGNNNTEAAAAAASSGTAAAHSGQRQQRRRSHAVAHPDPLAAEDIEAGIAILEPSIASKAITQHERGDDRVSRYRTNDGISSLSDSSSSSTTTTAARDNELRLPLNVRSMRRFEFTVDRERADGHDSDSEIPCK